MKLSKKDKIHLIDILGCMQVVQNYIDKEDTLICMKLKQKGTSEDYANNKGEFCVSINKQIGSEIVYLRKAIKMLSEFMGKKTNDN